MFNEKSKLVKDYVLLIKNGEKTIEDVPDFRNLKEVVTNVLNNSI
ncbi:CD1375 family protein [Solibacillus silvestris]